MPRVTGCGEACIGALLNKVPLKLGERAKDVEDKLPA